jgi:hypothetical protein
MEISIHIPGKYNKGNHSPGRLQGQILPEEGIRGGDSRGNTARRGDKRGGLQGHILAGDGIRGGDYRGTFCQERG